MKMKAAVFTNYGPPEVLRIEEIEKPQPKENEILIRIKSSAVNSGDWRLRRADPWLVRLMFGLFKPRVNVLGVTLSGVVEEVGSAVTKFKAGDEIYATNGTGGGAYAEYQCLNEDSIISAKPANISHEEAACIPFGGNTALHFLRKAGLKEGQKILIIGASGAIGTAAIQLSKLYGAEVTAVCSTDNVEMVRDLGADHVIDYKKQFLYEMQEEYDVIFETVGKTSYSDIKGKIKNGGTLLLASMSFNLMFGFGRKFKTVGGVMKESVEEMTYFKDLIESNKYKPIVDRTYKLEEIVEAHRYVEAGHKKGNVALTISDR